MSQVYATEPQTSGSVVFETTAGPLSIHLWCRECPHTVRYFLQLCVDGFYDNLVFHRIVPNFLIQTGDARFRQSAANHPNPNPNRNKDQDQDQDQNDTDESGHPWNQPPSKRYREKHQAAQALARRQYELNSRIRFNHRGQIAMALETTDDNDGDNDNDDDPSVATARLQPQFFVTLDEASHLDGKHVCFGGITGPTIFNALRIGRADIYHNEADDRDARNFRPRILSEAPRILRTKILAVDLPPALPAPAPTQDRSLVPWTVDPSTAPGTGGGGGEASNRKRKKKNRKGVRNTSLLSFGEEMNENDDGDDGDNDNDGDGKGGGTGGGVVSKKKKKMQSSHDVLNSKSLSAKTSIPSASVVKELAPAEATRVAQEEQERSKETTTTRIDTATATAATPIVQNTPKPSLEKDGETTNPESGNSHQQPAFSSRADRKMATARDAIPPSNGTAGRGHPEPAAATDAKKEKRAKKTSLVEARRARYACKNSNKKGSSKQQREDETMARFKAFQQKVTTGSRSESKSKSRHDDGDGGSDPAAYHGQVLETDADGGDKDGSNDWMRTKFKCRKHMDQDAKNMGGADGRGVDDYVVIEQRGSATDRKPGKRMRHRHG